MNVAISQARQIIDHAARIVTPAMRQAVDSLDPGRVIWDLPPTGLPSEMPMPRTGRSDVSLIDELMTRLPSR